MQITHKKEVKSPSLCLSLYNSGAVSCTHRKYKGWFTGAQVISGLRVNRTVLFKELKILQQFWVKKDKKSLIKLMAVVEGFEIDVLS